MSRALHSPKEVSNQRRVAVIVALGCLCLLASLWRTSEAVRAAKGDLGSPPLSPQAGCVAPPAGMVVWYPGDGNANDIQGPPLENATPGFSTNYVAGKVGQAFNISSSNAVLFTPSIFAGSSYTIDLWIRPVTGGTTGYQRVVGNSFFGAGFGTIYLVQNRIEYYQNGENNLRVASSTGSVPFDVYTHIAITYDNNVNRLYINGTLAGTSAAHSGDEVFHNSLYIGDASDDGGNTFFGQIDEFEVFNRALSQAEIQSIVTANGAGKCKPAVIPTPTPTPTPTPIPTPNLDPAPTPEGCAGAVDSFFNSNTGEAGGSGEARALAVQSDGKIIVGGKFIQYNGVRRDGIARVNPDGSLDTSFNPGFGNVSVEAVALQPDGKILIAGNFTQFNGDGIARLNADGSLDTSFNSPSGSSGFHLDTLAVQPDGKILIGGFFSQINGVSRNGIARLNPDGSLDTSFDPGSGVSSSRVHAFAFQTDGRIVIGGSFSQYNGVARRSIARVNADGSLDTSFNPGSGVTVGNGGDGVIEALAVQPDGKILIAGSFFRYNGVGRSNIARVNTNGSLDTSFNPGSGIQSNIFSSTTINALILQPDGKIVIGGRFTHYNGVARSNIARVNADGSLDTSFNPGSGTNNSVIALTLQPDGKIVAGGQSFTLYNGARRNSIARVNTNGSLDASFDPVLGLSGNSGVFDLAVQPDGRILIAGQFNEINGVRRLNIARLNADGSLDASFNPGLGTDQPIYVMALQPNGKILISGGFDDYNGVTRLGLARLNTDGSLDTSFDPGSGVGLIGEVFALALQPDGKIVIGGDFSQYNGVARSDVARVNTNGSLDISFNPGTGAKASVRALALQPDGKILIGGRFTQFNGVTRNSVARLNANGSLDLLYNPGSGFTSNPGHLTDVYALVFQPDGKLLVGGDFDYYNGVTRHSLARLNPNASLDTSFNPGLETFGTDFRRVSDLALQTDGKIVISGIFSEVKGVRRNGLARINADGSLDTSFDAGCAAGFSPIELQPDGKVLIGGFFTDTSGTVSSGPLRLLGDSNCPSLVNVVQFSHGTYNVTEECSFVTITLTRSGNTSAAATVDYSTGDRTAQQRTDYTLGTGTVTFAAGQNSQSFPVLISEDSYVEGTETLSLTLTNPTNGLSLGTYCTAIVQILDDDTINPPTVQPIDDASIFVAQHYHDFLNRQHDVSGHAFWTNEITSCGSNAGCVDFKRMSVSQAFFLSIEFQQTGYFVFRLYKSTFTDSAARPRGMPRYREFLRDTRQIGRNVVVLVGNWQQQLEDNRREFARQWVQKPEFLAEFPLNMTAGQFVDKLFQNSEVTPLSGERNAAIAAFGGGDVEGRAAALRNVADSGSVYNRQFNPAFVLMQYIGYLRRNPNDAPDNNYAGFDFWLSKMNQFSLPGEDVRNEEIARLRAQRAEMVRAFILSVEYRARFGP